MDGWRERERDGLLEERRVLGWLCATFGFVALGGVLIASLAAIVVGTAGATYVVGRLHSLRAAERLLGRR